MDTCKVQQIKRNGGERGIRTLDTVSRIHAFQACAFSRSAISPALFRKLLRGRAQANLLIRFYGDALSTATRKL